MVGEALQDMDLGKIEELIDTTLEKLKDDLREVSVSEPVPDGEEDIEEAVPENKLTLLDNLAEGFVIQDCFKLLS